MSGESYTRWRSDSTSDDDDDDEDGEGGIIKTDGGRGGREGRGSGRSAVTIVPASSHQEKNLRDPTQLRMSFILGLICVVCASVGGLIGYCVGSWHDSSISSEMPKAVNYSYKEFGTDKLYAKHITDMLDHLQPGVIKNYLRDISRTKNTMLSDYIGSMWRAQGLETTTTKFSVTLSKPSRKKPNTLVVTFREGQNETLDSYLSHELETQPFLAYSPPGIVNGPVVYGHYGRRGDFQTLQSLKVNVKGCIVLLRYGKLHIGSKLHNAEQAGAIGALFYPDPIDFQGPRGGGEPYPNGTGLPEDGIIWKTLNTLPGDPATPFLPSIDNIYRYSEILSKENDHLPNIPAHTISSKAAARLMTLMQGPAVPKPWRGGLEITHHGEIKLEYNLGGSWWKNITNFTLTVNNEIFEETIYNIHASLPALDNTRVIMIGCHYGALHKEPGIGLASLLALSESLFKAFAINGTQRKVVFSAWAASQHGTIGSTEFAQLNPQWLDKKVMGYLSLDEMLVGTGTLRVMASPSLRQSIKEAATMVDWPEKSKAGRVINVREGWRLSDPLSNNDVHISSPGSGSDFVSFTAQNGIPSGHFVAMGKNWAKTYSLQHSQYDTKEAYAKFLDPDFKWAHMITSLVGTVATILSEKELPPVIFSELSGDLYNGWTRFLNIHFQTLNKSGYPFDGILNSIDKEIEVLNNHLVCLDGWYNDTAIEKHKVHIDDYNNRFYHEQHHRQIEERLQQFMMLERGLLGPRGVGRSYTTNVMIGPDPEDPESPIHYPHAARSITLALRHKTPWESVHQELSYILAALYSYRDLFDSHTKTWCPS